MNYLAHAVIGGGAARPDVLVGNFIGDAVKGSQWQAFSAGVQEGILLHRAIDAAADAHPVAVASRALLRPRFQKMAGVALDLLHDHFLAQSFAQHEAHPGGLAGFAREVEGVLSARAAEMPERSQRFLTGLVRYRWLEGYGDPDAMRAICAAMDARIPWETQLVGLMELEEALKQELEAGFHEVFRDVRATLGGRAGLGMR